MDEPPKRDAPDHYTGRLWAENTTDPPGVRGWLRPDGAGWHIEFSGSIKRDGVYLLTGRRKSGEPPS